MFDNYYYEEDPEMYDHSNYDEDPESYEDFIEEQITEKVDEWKADTKIWTEDKWLIVPEIKKETFNCDLILKHEFHHGEENKVVIFGIDGAENGSDMTLNYISRDKILDEDLRNSDLIVKGTVDAAYAVVEDVIKHFDNSQINEDEFALYLANQVKRNNENILIKEKNMSDNNRNDPEKMLNWDKKLGEQSEYVKKAIESLFIGKFPAEKKIGDLVLLDKIFIDNEKSIAEQLQKSGIEGIIFPDRVDRFSNENLNKENFNWGDAKELHYFNDSLTGDYLKNYVVDKKNPSFFVVEPLDNNNLKIRFFIDSSDIMDHKSKFYVDSNVNIDTAKKIVEKTVGYFNTLEDYKFSDMKEYIKQQFSDRQLETAQKTGYVQGVCESVLAFNTDENRKIMSESTMIFLSKKLMSEMNVTKEMAQKFANPETYKALEQCVFAQKQEQQLEQTQSHGRGM